MFMVTLGTIVFGLAITIGIYWLLFNNPSGERYLRQRTQGPFAPTPDDLPAAISKDRAP